MTARPVPQIPGQGQESVWDYPRPPRVEHERRERPRCGSGACASRHPPARSGCSRPATRPTYYLPDDDFLAGALSATEHSSWCEFKGQAAYFDVYGGGDAVALRAAWTYPRPSPGFEAITGYVAVDAGRDGSLHGRR